MATTETQASFVQDTQVSHENGAAKDNINNKRIIAARAWTVLAVLVWFTAAFVAGLLGIVNQPGRPPLVLLGFLAVPTLGFVAAYRMSAAFRAFLQSRDLTQLVEWHGWRALFGLVFLLAWLRGALPAGFAIPAGGGDIIAAAGALALLPLLHRGTASRGWLLAWNIWGFLDLLNALALGLLYSDSALGILSAGTPTSRFAVTFPVSLIPTFFVPLYLLSHAVIFKRIAEMRSPTGDNGRLS